MTPSSHSVTLRQGTTQRVPFIRQYIPFAVEGDACSGYTNACTGEPVQPGDITDEDYSGCTARMQIRADATSPGVILELTTENGGIELDGNKLTLVFQPEDTTPISFRKAVGHVEVVRPNGDVERHYEITFALSLEVTR